MYYLIIFYFFLSLGVAFLGQGRKIGFPQSLVLSIFFTPIVGLFAVAHSDKKITYREFQYHCTRCAYNYTEEHEFCPNCTKGGHTVRLIKEVITTT